MPQIFDYSSFYEDLYDSLVEEFLDSLLNGEIDLDDLPPDSDLAIKIKPDIDFINSKLPLLEEAREGLDDLVQVLEQLLISMEQKAAQINFTPLSDKINELRVATGNDPVENDIPFFNHLDDLAEDMVNFLPENYLRGYLYSKFPIAYNGAYPLFVNTGSSNAIFVNSLPPISSAQLLNEASKYRVYNYLKNRLNTFDADNPNQPPWQINIDHNNPHARSRTIYKRYGIKNNTNNLVENTVKNIIIKSPISMKEGLLDLVFEMTNANNAHAFDYIAGLAIKNECKKDAFVYTFLYYEAMALYNEMEMAKDLGMNLTQTFGTTIEKYYNDFKSGQINKEGFLEKVTLYDLKNDLPRVNLYRETYDKLRRIGAQAGY
jgi:hypothetical protein